MARRKSDWSYFDNEEPDDSSPFLAGKQYDDFLGSNNPSVSAPESGSGGSTKGAALGGAMATGNPYIIAAAAAYEVFSGIQQAEVIRQNAEITKQIANMNAEGLEYDAFKAEQHGMAEIAAYQPTIDSTIGEQRVAFAANNVDASYGTAAELQQETKLTGVLNTIAIQRQARARALGLKQQARNTRLNAQLGHAQAQATANATENVAAISGTRTALTGYARK